MAETANLEITHITANQAENYATANEAFDALDGAIAGLLTVDCAGSSDVTLTDAQALANMIFSCTGTLTGNINLIVPTNTKFYAIVNGTSGAFTVTVKTSAGTGILVPQGFALLLYCDGTNVEQVTTATLLASFAVASLPAVGPAGMLIYVPDETGGAIPAFSDGTNWRRVTDRAVVS